LVRCTDEPTLVDYAWGYSIYQSRSLYIPNVDPPPTPPTDHEGGGLETYRGAWVCKHQEKNGERKLTKKKRIK
jgi:hypothetical protein